MFADIAMAARIEGIEVHATRAVAGPLVGSGSAPQAIVRPVGAGVAVFIRPGSPFNKLIGAGLDAPIDDAVLDELERVLADRREPVRVELATLAAPETGTRLTERGYRLLGFENVLARRLTGEAPPAGDIRIERITGAPEAVWRDIVTEGAAAPDGTGAPPDDYSHEVLDAAMTDSLAARDCARYLAYVDGIAAGGASVCVHDGVALLGGSATLPAHRRRGVQAALIRQRLHDAHAAGADLAVVTTAPGTRSQANLMKFGFALVYARAILVRG